jgi:hypothetical protein
MKPLALLTAIFVKCHRTDVTVQVSMVLHRTKIRRTAATLYFPADNILIKVAYFLNFCHNTELHDPALNGANVAGNSQVRRPLCWYCR